MAENVFIITFEEDSKSYQAFTELKQFHQQKKIVGQQMAVLQNDADAGFLLKDFIDFTGSDKTAKGSLIGAVVGIIGGPLGVLLGWMGGSFIGATGDAREIQTAMSVFEEVLTMVSPGKTGVMLIARAEDKPVIDDYAYPLGGQVIRMDAEYVKEEIKKAQLAQFELQKEARKQWRNKDKNEK